MLTFLFPRQCVLCSQEGSYLCPVCKKTLQPALELCPTCHIFSKDFAVCLDCKGKGNYLEGIITPFVYTAALQKLLVKFRDRHRKDIAGFLSQRLSLAILAHGVLGRKEQIIFTHVPSHRLKISLKTGYTPSLSLARLIAQELGMKHENLLIKSTYTRSQSSRSPYQRLLSPRGTFSLRKNISLSGTETIVLVDDIVGTGITLQACAKVLKEQYPKLSIRGLVCAKTFH